MKELGSHTEMMTALEYQAKFNPQKELTAMDKPKRLLDLLAEGVEFIESDEIIYRINDEHIQWYMPEDKRWEKRVRYQYVSVSTSEADDGPAKERRMNPSLKIVNPFNCTVCVPITPATDNFDKICKYLNNFISAYPMRGVHFEVARHHEKRGWYVTFLRAE